MVVIPISTRKFLPPKDNLDDLLAYITDLNENDIVVVTSKIISICEGRCIERSQISKEKIIINQLRHCIISTGILLPHSGVDVSNACGHYVLLPEDSVKSADNIRNILKRKFNIKNLAVIITDSIGTNFRIADVELNSGLIGLSIASVGINPLKNYIGIPDLFGLPIKESKIAVTDSIAVAANLVMGEGAESRPLAIVKIPDIDLEFID